MNLSPNVNDYTIHKDGAWWKLLCKGSEAVSILQTKYWFKRKRDAVAAIPECAETAAELARQRSQDPIYGTEPIVWSDEEEQQIREYVSALINNEPQRTLWGERYPVHAGRVEQEKDQRCIESWYAWGEPADYGQNVCIGLRRVMAARAEAFKRAGIALYVERENDSSS